MTAPHVLLGRYSGNPNNAALGSNIPSAALGDLHDHGLRMFKATGLRGRGGSCPPVALTRVV
jgi:hypothetical protein